MTLDSRTIWKRRVTLMAIIAIVVAVPVTMLVRSDDDDNGVPDGPAIDVPSLKEAEYDRDLGVKLRLPRGWHSKREEGVLELRSKNAGTRIAISAPGPAADVAQLYDETLAELRASYRSFEVRKELKNSDLGGLRSRAATIDAVPRGGSGATRLLVSTAPGDKRAYLVVVSTPASGSGKSLVEAQALLNQLKLVG